MKLRRVLLAAPVLVALASLVRRLGLHGRCDARERKDHGQDRHQRAHARQPSECNYTAPTSLTITPGKGLNRAPDLIYPPSRIEGRTTGYCMVKQSDGLIVMGHCEDAATFSIAVGGRAAVAGAPGADPECMTIRNVEYTSSVVSRAAISDCHNSLRTFDGTFTLTSDRLCLGGDGPSHFGFMVPCDDGDASWWQLRPNGRPLRPREQSAPQLRRDEKRARRGRVARRHGALWRARVAMGPRAGRRDPRTRERALPR
jgi:hypothetical protein